MKLVGRDLSEKQAQCKNTVHLFNILSPYILLSPMKKQPTSLDKAQKKALSQDPGTQSHLYTCVVLSVGKALSHSLFTYL